MNDTADLKTCFKCQQEKPRSDFYKHSQMGDGLLGKCKECAKSDARERRFNPATRLKVLEYDRLRGSRQTYSYTQAYRAQFPEKFAAHQAVNYAVRTGRIVRPDRCERCGDARLLHGHHHDYSKPLDVVWLCAPCHKQVHLELHSAQMAA